jgi:hypothetical protein
MNIKELFWDASLEELKCGYIEKAKYYECLLCGEKIEKGIIYPDEGLLYEAVRYIGIHIEKNHGSVFDYLIHMDKSLTGLSEHQNSLLKLFYQGRSDAEVQLEMDIGSVSTIRNHRFVLKEKERQSKVFLAMMELLKEQDKQTRKSKSHQTVAKVVDDHYKTTQEESEKILKKYFPQGIDGTLKTFAIKEKHKLIVLQEISKRFQIEQIYTEKEVNKILEAVYNDYVTLRRYLIEYDFLDRKADGSEYWVKNDFNRKEAKNMDRKKELKQLYKETKTQAGIYQIKNIKNQKVLVVATPNLKTMNGKIVSLESGGGHRNTNLQKELIEFGKEAFVFEVLEVLETKEDGYFDFKDELKKLEKKWLDRLQPFGDRGYNEKKE